MKPGETLTLTITDVSRGGAGVARTENGRAIFIPFTVSGDVVNAKITELKKKYATAELQDIVKASPDRVSARCQVFGKCGGCQWQHIPYTKQWQIKLSGIHKAISASHIKFSDPIQEFPAKQIWNYRNRIQLRGFQNELGYYAPRSHDIVAIEHCDIASAPINNVLGDINIEGRKFNAPYKVEVEILGNGELHTYWNKPHAAAGFRQVNDEQNSKLKHWVENRIGSQPIIYDLYGGSANLSSNLAAKNIKVYCVDLSAPDPRPSGVPESLEFHRSDVLPWLKQRITDIKYKRTGTPQTSSSAIIDPPRGGLANEFDDILERLEFLNVVEVVAVGCKTDTWARDIARFITRGWKLQEIAVFDFFPHTIHLESTAYLTRN